MISRYVPDMGFKLSVEIGSKVLDRIFKRVHLWLEFGLPAEAQPSLLLVDAILLAQSLFPVLLVRILLGKVIDSHPSGFALILLWLLATSFWAFSDLGIVDVLVLWFSGAWTISQNRRAYFWR